MRLKKSPSSFFERLCRIEIDQFYLPSKAIQWVAEMGRYLQWPLAGLHRHSVRIPETANELFAEFQAMRKIGHRKKQQARNEHPLNDLPAPQCGVEMTSWMLQDHPHSSSGAVPPRYTTLDVPSNPNHLLREKVIIGSTTCFTSKSTSAADNHLLFP